MKNNSEIMTSIFNIFSLSVVPYFDSHWKPWYFNKQNSMVLFNWEGTILQSVDCLTHRLQCNSIVLFFYDNTTGLSQNVIDQTWALISSHLTHCPSWWTWIVRVRLTFQKHFWKLWLALVISRKRVNKRIVLHSKLK